MRSIRREPRNGCSSGCSRTASTPRRASRLTGLSTPGEPDIGIASLDDRMLAWIDVGEPSFERLKKACRLAERIHVYSFNAKSPIWWEKQERGSRRAPPGSGNWTGAVQGAANWSGERWRGRHHCRRHGVHQHGRRRSDSPGGDLRSDPQTGSATNTGIFRSFA